MSDMSASPSPAIRIEIEGTIGWVIVDNPSRHNALTLAMWQAIGPAIATLDADSAVRVIALVGADGGAFASGADISEFTTVRATPEAAAAYEAANSDAFAAIRNAAKPTVAVIRRFCMGGGLGLAVACDLRLAAADAVFAIPAARLGLAYPPEAIADIVALVGPARTRHLFFTARRVGADEALAMGLIDSLLPSEGLDAGAREELQTIADLAPLTHRAVKAAIRAALAPGDREAARQAAEAANLCFGSRDYAEGRTAFLEKRSARFDGH